MLGADSPIAHKAREQVAEILRGGRSAGVGLAYAGQRGVVQYTGSKDMHANAGNKIVLRINQPAEMNNILPGWELDGMPDMYYLRPRRKGVALVVGPDGSWRAGRIGDLHDLDAVADLARRRGRPTAALPPGIAAALPGYATRNDPAAAASGAAILTLPTTRTGTARTRPPAAGSAAVGRRPAHPARRRRGRPARRHARTARPAHLAGRPDRRPRTRSTPPRTTTRQPTGPSPSPQHRRPHPGPARRARRRRRPPRRDRRRCSAGPAPRWPTWLAILRDHGLITASGSTSAARYYLPEHAPDAGDDTADGTPADDDAA